MFIACRWKRFSFLESRNLKINHHENNANLVFLLPCHIGIPFFLVFRFTLVYRKQTRRNFCRYLGALNSWVFSSPQTNKKRYKSSKTQKPWIIQPCLLLGWLYSVPTWAVIWQWLAKPIKIKRKKKLEITENLCDLW